MIKLKPYQQGRVLCSVCGNEYKTPPRQHWKTEYNTGKAYTYCPYCHKFNYEEDVQAVEYRPAWR